MDRSPRPQNAPSTMITAGPRPDRSYPIVVPSFDVTWLMTASATARTRSSRASRSTDRPR